MWSKLLIKTLIVVTVAISTPASQIYLDMYDGSYVKSLTSTATIEMLMEVDDAS